MSLGLPKEYLANRGSYDDEALQKDLDRMLSNYQPPQIAKSNTLNWYGLKSRVGFL